MKPRFQKLIPKPTTIGLGLIAVLLAVNVLVSEWNIGRLIENEHRVVHTHEVLATIEEVLSTVTEAETAERGFLITDDEQYLKSYESAIININETLDHLTNLTLDERNQEELIAAIRELVAARLEESRRAIAARRAGALDAAQQSVSTNLGRRLMNELRKLVGEMKHEEQGSLSIAAAQSRRSAFVTKATDFLGADSGLEWFVCPSISSDSMPATSPNTNPGSAKSLKSPPSSNAASRRSCTKASRRS
jgi:CHASE3 domain sensor protein